MESILEILKHQEIGKVIWALVALLAGLLISRQAAKLADQVLKRARLIDPTLHTVIRTGVKWLGYFLSLLVAAGLVGIPVTSFVALFSLVGLAVSLAMQGVLSNLAGGLILLASKPFALGDFIESDSFSGTVKEIRALHTYLISPDGKLIFVPNSLIYNSRILNYTVLGKRRLDLSVSASYDSAPEAVRAAALQAVSTVPGVLTDPAPQVLLEAYGDSAIQYTVRLWTTPDAYWDVRYQLSEALYGAFKENSVEMTYPHLNVHMR